MQQQKQQIKAALKSYCEKMGSQNAAERSLDGVNSATISQVLNDNWDLISDDMWRNIAAGIKMKTGSWVVVETSVFTAINGFFGDSKRNPNGIRAIVANASMGKSVAVEHFTTYNPSSYYIRCHRHISIRMMLRDMLKAMGKDSSGTTAEMLDNLVKYLERDNEPLFIIDEVDKLKDDVLGMFVDLENKLHKKCGLVFLSTPYLKKRIESGVARNKMGFGELYSRLKKNFWDVNPNKKEFVSDVISICKSNGVLDDEAIIEITNRSDNDFRVVSDLIYAYINNPKRKKNQ